MSTATVTSTSRGDRFTSLNSTTPKRANTKTKYASQRYRDNLSRWLTRLQEADAFNKSDRELGVYITSFIEYLERSTGKKTDAREGDKNGYATRWKKAATNPNFQKLDQDGWEIKFIEFAITGKLETDFSATEYFETGTESLLPANAWRLKKIPSTFVDAPNAGNGNISQKFALMEERITQLEKTIKIMTQGQEKSSFSQLLGNWVKLEAQRSQLPIDITIDHLTNRLGCAASSTEIKDIIDGTYPIAEARVKHYATWVASLGILTDANGQAYTGKELIAMLPTKTIS